MSKGDDLPSKKFGNKNAFNNLRSQLEKQLLPQSAVAYSSDGKNLVTRPLYPIP
jgi:hypothetical protein